jgi:hypothetical protein
MELNNNYNLSNNIMSFIYKQQYLLCEKGRKHS